MRVGEMRRNFESGDGNREMRGRVWAMTGDVAQRIVLWLQRRGGTVDVRNVQALDERRKYSIGAWMQSDVKAANLSENLARTGVKATPTPTPTRIPRYPCILDQFVPECTEAML